MSTSNILTEQSNTVNILSDGVHPYDHPEDKWVICIDGEEVAWHTGTKLEAEAAYHDMLRVECDHQRKLGRWWEWREVDDYGLDEVTL